ncbi:hypothetical protein GCM10011403_25340 [Pseudohongiella nitratireducens]|uniref:TonB C-terminal domain-containing protein n=1 Tax=Pseudohongiella nitratireducens TaxID=1768907 RepID=A0A916QLH7_9GAMM|nr:M56 family metallopeptidase [Pseudohongiella nitratireducens]GFZ81118.1 hypothetical protein GCM10011403_25340 [Pseudohongiella nitratireducens]
MISSDLFLSAIGASPALSYLTALLAQSLFVLGVLSVVELGARKYLRGYQPVMSVVLWQCAFFLLLALPVLPLLSLTLQRAAPLTGVVSPVFEVTVMAGQSANFSSQNFVAVALGIYALVALYLILKLGFSYFRLMQLQSTAMPVRSCNLELELNRCVQQLNIKKEVRILVSEKIDSPISFGWQQGTIVLPANHQQWSDSAMTDVLLHELCHLRRNDWLVLMLTHVLCALFWANPMVWLAQNRLLAVTESRCDQDVVNQGRDQITYAESLMGVAHSCQQCQQQPSPSNWLPAQLMFDRNTLKARLNQVLKETTMKTNQNAQLTKKTIWGSSALSLLMLSVLAFNPILSAQERQPEQPPRANQVDQPALPSLMEQPASPQQVAQAPSAAREPAPREVDQEIRPMHQVEAAYPPAAADEGIEGWAQVKFTVSEEGTVPVSSISMVDAEPLQVFDESAKAAIAQFRFQPRVVNGQPVAVPNVQYVFRFTMDDE